jgi:hypothetical protein
MKKEIKNMRQKKETSKRLRIWEVEGNLVELETTQTS